MGVAGNTGIAGRAIKLNYQETSVFLAEIIMVDPWLKSNLSRNYFYGSICGVF